MTVYFETVPSNFLERALYLEAERLAFLPSALDQDKFDTEREVVKNERRQSVDNLPFGKAHEALLAAVYPPGHPYSWSVIGSMEDLNAASLDDLRRFFAEFYHPGNATLCLAGDFDPKQAKAWINTYFAPLKAGTSATQKGIPATPAVSQTLSLTDSVQLPRLYWTWPSVPSTHKDSPALDLLATILADGDAARLNRALVRETKVAKDVSAESDTHEVGGQFILMATAAEGHTLDDLRNVLAAQLRRLAEQPPTEAELHRALAKFEKSTYGALTSPLGRATVLAIGSSQHNDPTWYQKDFKRFMRVTVGDLKRVAATYLIPDKVELVVVPAEKDAQTNSNAKVDIDPFKQPAATRPAQADTRPIPDRTPNAASSPDWTAMPGPSKPLPFEAPRFERHTLSNGVDVWVAPWHTVPLVSLRLLVPVGTADDPAEQNGLAALTGRLLEQGTQTHPATEFAEMLDALGASLVVSTGPDHTAYNMGVLAHQLDPSLKLLSEALQQPRFDPEDFDREQDMLLADLRQGPDDPAWLAQRAFRNLLFGSNHPYGKPAQGFASTVEKLTLKDVTSFHHAHFGPQGATLVVVGDVEPKDLIQELERVLAGWKGTGAGPKDRPRAPVGNASKPGVVYVLDKPGAVQSVIQVGRCWVDRSDPAYFTTLIGNRILGDDFLSRLNQNLREEHGYSYGAGSNFLFRRVGSTWSASSKVRGDATADALKEVIGELDALAGDEPFSDEEIATARDAEARSYPEAFESPAGIAGVLEEMATQKLPLNYVQTYLGNLQTPTGEAINQAMATLVQPAARVILVVGDRAAIEPALKEAGFPSIVPVDNDGNILKDR